MDEKCVIDPQRDCIGYAKAVVLEQRIEMLEKWQSDSKDFHDRFDNWQRQQIDRDARIDEKLNYMSSNVEQLVNWQKEQQKKPARLIDNIKTNIIWAVIAAILGLILGRVGLGA